MGFYMKTLGYINSLSAIKSSCPSSISLHAVNPLTGIDMGIPLNMIQNIFTTLHYGEDITTYKYVLLQFMIGYYTYGKDRYNDALEYEESEYETAKSELYKLYIQYKDVYKISFEIMLLAIVYILVFDDKTAYNLPFILLLCSSEYYKQIKLINPWVKPLYISVMWSLSTIALPCVLHDHDYSILASPMDYLPCVFTMFASSVILDIRDIKEDTINDVPTLPVKYGLYKSQQIIIALLALSSFIFGMNQNYLANPTGNIFFEFLNLGLSSYVFGLNDTHIIQNITEY